MAHTRLEGKVEAAKAALQEIFSDTSVPQSATKEALEEVAAEAELLASTLGD